MGFNIRVLYTYDKGASFVARYILTFTTPGGNYVYDREVNSLLSVSDEEFVSFRRIEEGTDTEEDWGLLRRYTEQGYLQETRLKKIEHPATCYMPFHLSDYVSQITLQVTQDCNLRCKYCTYSGNYTHQRGHEKRVMTLENMKKSIDFIMRRSRKVKEINIGFYGGEPFLEIDNIKKCVDYIKQSYKGKTVKYTVTTNGTLLNDKVVNFLLENESFSINISFDGPKELHDINRVFVDGSGSYDCIMTQVTHIKNNYPKLFSRMFFLSTVSPGTDLACIAEFYDANDVISDVAATYNTVNTQDINESILYDDLYHNTFSYEYMKSLLSAMDKYSKNKVSKLFSTNLVDIERLYDGLGCAVIAEKMHPSGPCLPGVMRPFVSVDGNIYPCERIGEESEIMKIGHIDTDFDFNKVEVMLNVGTITHEECKVCWNFIHCGLCIAACDGGSVLSRDVRLANCHSSKRNTIMNLQTLCLLLENGYDFSTRTISKESAGV